MIDTPLSDLRYAARRLARAPGFCAAVVLSLALGIGANVTMFGIVDALLFRPPAHVRDVDRVVRLVSDFPIPIHTFPDYVDYQRARSFTSMAAYLRPTSTARTASWW
jgi:hypothetical protein